MPHAKQQLQSNTPIFIIVCKCIFGERQFGVQRYNYANILNLSIKLIMLLKSVKIRTTKVIEMNIDNGGLSGQDFGQLTPSMRNASVTIQKLSDNGVKEQSFEQVLHISE